MSKRTGGSAFPNDWEPNDMGSTGMTLRDYFAARAMQFFLTNDETTFQEDAEAAYMMADAMLTERNRND